MNNSQLPRGMKGYILRAIFVRDKGGGILDIAAPVQLVASDEGRDAVLAAYSAEQTRERPGWRVIDQLCDEIAPRLLRAALGLDC